jgi:hypothetical protein
MFMEQINLVFRLGSHPQIPKDVFEAFKTKKLKSIILRFSSTLYGVTQPVLQSLFNKTWIMDSIVRAGNLYAVCRKSQF